MNSEIIYGRNSVEGLLENSDRSINKIMIAKGIKFDHKMSKIINTARTRGIPVQEVPREKLNAMTDGVHQGIIATVSPIEYMDLDDFINNLDTNKHSIVVILDGVEDPHNFGSIIRTSAGAGVDGIIIPKRRSSPVTSTVEKASAGTISKVPIIQVTNLSQAIEKLKKQNFWIVGAEASGDKYYFETDFNMNCAIVMGGEDQGISQNIKKNCDFLVKIPLPGDINSLNVANAASVIIYEVVRQRILKKEVLI